MVGPGFATSLKRTAPALFGAANIGHHPSSSPPSSVSGRRYDNDYARWATLEDSSDDEAPAPAPDPAEAAAKLFEAGYAAYKGLKGAPADAAKAVKLWEQAAAKGSGRALVELARCHYDGAAAARSPRRPGERRVAATRLDGISASRPRRRLGSTASPRRGRGDDPSRRNLRGAAAATTRLDGISASRPRRRRDSPGNCPRRGRGDPASRAETSSARRRRRRRGEGRGAGRTPVRTSGGAGRRARQVFARGL